MTEGRCCICKAQIDTDTSPILLMSGAGKPRCLCAECDAAIVKATTDRDPEAITDACREIGERLKNGDSNDMRVITTVTDIVKDARERRDKIAAGEYDFALDEKVDEDEFEITDDLKETEEDRALDEKESKVNKIIDTVTTWVVGIAIVAAMAFIVIKFILK